MALHIELGGVTGAWMVLAQSNKLEVGKALKKSYTIKGMKNSSSEEKLV